MTNHESHIARFENSKDGVVFDSGEISIADNQQHVDTVRERFRDVEDVEITVSGKMLRHEGPLGGTTWIYDAPIHGSCPSRDGGSPLGCGLVDDGAPP